jgi:hypothetical protein
MWVRLSCCYPALIGPRSGGHFGSGDMIVALTSSRWNGADWRGRQVCIRYGGASVTATVRGTLLGLLRRYAS